MRRGATINFSQAMQRLIEGHLKEKVLLLYITNLGKTAVLPVLPMVATLGRAKGVMPAIPLCSC